MSSAVLRNARLLRGLLLVLAPAGLTLAMAYQRRWLDDDGFINLRIVRNVLEGYGPVFNLGERVEAGTSPLWLALLTLLGALGARLEDASVYAGIALSVCAGLVAQNAAQRLHAPEGSALGARLRLLWLPLGAAVVAVLPPFWDYASAGLETGLSLFWLATAYDVLVTQVASGLLVRVVDQPATSDETTASEPARVDVTPSASAPSLASQLASAAWLGLGILIRPELTLYALAFFALYLAALARSLPVRRELLLRALALGAAFGVLPVCYQLFRMGYYGTLSPNTAIAKEAFLANWEQGFCYFRNFVDTYRLKLPLLALSLVLTWLASDHAARRVGRERALVLGALLLPPAIGVVHGLYVVRMGGDYMHARMFLPATFALLLPVAAVPVQIRLGALTAGSFAGRALLAACAAVVLGWAWLCASSLRVPEENQCGIGDERGWYARMAQLPNPVRLEEYEKHPFYGWSRGLVDTIAGSCPQIHTATDGSTHPGCRLVHLTPDEAHEIYPFSLTYPMAAEVDPRLLGVIPQGAIGISGFMLPGNVHLADAHGLADPWVARVVLPSRGRPGHEKTLPVVWRLARFGAKKPGEDASLTAARRALTCGSLGTLDRAIRAPLSVSQFFSNLWHARAHTRLRVPRDPFEAEARYCGSARLKVFVTASEGGDAFHWLCPDARAVSVLRGSFSTPSAAVAQLSAGCVDPSARGQSPLLGPSFGPFADAPFELACPLGSSAVGIFGHADHVVHALGLICSTGPLSTRTNMVGAAIGPAFEFVCPKGQRVRSLRGRAGALLDAVGIGCAASAQ